MFEVNVFDPHQTGALFSWLAVNRGPCSCVVGPSSLAYQDLIRSACRVLIHPNTGDALKDHSELATWMGQRYPLILDFLKPQARG